MSGSEKPFRCSEKPFRQFSSHDLIEKVESLDFMAMETQHINLEYYFNFTKIRLLLYLLAFGSSILLW